MAGSCTGTSVLGLTFQGGVIIASDTLVSYGSMARFKNCERIKVVNDHTVVAATGDYADYQFLSKIIHQKQIDEKQWNDGLQLYPAALHSWITRVSYNRRSKFQPLYCAWVVGGLQPNDKTGALEPFLGFVDKLGTSYKSNVVATGFGQYLATPLVRELTELEGLPAPIKEHEARTLVAKCMEVLYYRDARSLPKYQVVVIKPDGVQKESPAEIGGEWNIAHHVKGY
jgi:20S proteasome subunit beta 7